VSQSYLKCHDALLDNYFIEMIYQIVHYLQRLIENIDECNLLSNVSVINNSTKSLAGLIIFHDNFQREVFLYPHKHMIMFVCIFKTLHGLSFLIFH
jgi:hypothetical protein